VRILTNTAFGFAVIPGFEAVVSAGAAERRGSADHGVPAFDLLRFARAISKAVVEKILRADAGVAVRA
jgi:hypothetical protein